MLYTRKGDGGTTKTFGCDLPAPRPGTFFVYAILCDDDSIYIGQTNDLQTRWRQHSNGLGANYFKRHKPLKYVHFEEYSSRTEAVKREHNLKTGFGRKWLKRELEAGRTRQAGQRISKSSAIAEALGSLDEINSFLGLCKAHPKSKRYKLATKNFSKIVHNVQENLFIIQAELAGAPNKTITDEKVKELEFYTDFAEKEMPPIKSFFIPGATELGAFFDIARTIARRAERRVTAVLDEGSRGIGIHSRSYLNRLSSLLYALARLSNHKSGITEEPPSYK